MYIRSDVTNTIPDLQPTNTPTSWDPSTISNLIFGIIMVFVGIIAIWQGRNGRVVALDGVLTVTGPLNSFRSQLSPPDIEFDGVILPPMCHVISDSTSPRASPPQVAIGNRDRNSDEFPNGSDSISISAVSSRVTTLSSAGFVNNSAQGTHILTAELDIADVEGCDHIKDAPGHQCINLDAAP